MAQNPKKNFDIENFTNILKFKKKKTFFNYTNEE